MDASIIVIVTLFVSILGWTILLRNRSASIVIPSASAETFRPGFLGYLSVIGYAIGGAFFCALNFLFPKADSLSWAVFGGIGVLLLLLGWRALVKVKSSCVVVGRNEIVITTGRTSRRIPKSEIRDVLVSYGHMVIVQRDDRRTVLPLFYRNSPRLIALVQQR